MMNEIYTLPRYYVLNDDTGTQKSVRANNITEVHKVITMLGLRNINITTQEGQRYKVLDNGDLRFVARRRAI